LTDDPAKAGAAAMRLWQLPYDCDLLVRGRTTLTFGNLKVCC
jgi:hypothetical protein